MANSKGKAKWSSELSEKAIAFTHPDIMMKMICTVDKRGWPHITVITSNRAIAKDKIVWGRFTDGLSKEIIEEVNPKQGILFMSAEMPFKILQIKAKFTHMSTEGPDIEYFNESQLMRYMTYARVYKVYYNEIISATQIRTLPLLKLVGGILRGLIGRGKAKTNRDEKALNVIGYEIFRGMMNPKFIAYIDPEDGYPVIFPCIQAIATDHNRIVFPINLLNSDIMKIPIGDNIAILGLNMDLASQLINGPYRGIQKYRGIKMGVIEIEEVYNSVPPLPGRYYPKLDVREKITDFHL